MSLENDLDEIRLVGNDLKELFTAVDQDKNDIKNYLNLQIEKNEKYLQFKRKKDNEIRLFYDDQKKRLKGKVGKHYA